MDKPTIFQYLSEFIWHRLFNIGLRLALWPFKIRGKKNFPSCSHRGFSRATSPAHKKAQAGEGLGLGVAREGWEGRKLLEGKFLQKDTKNPFTSQMLTQGIHLPFRLWILLKKDKSSFQERAPTALELIPKPRAFCANPLTHSPYHNSRV